jgi:uncharacterized protein (TIGR00369 family)
MRKKTTKKRPELAKEALEFARNRLKKSRVPAMLGFHVEELSHGRAVLSMQVQDLHKQIHDVVHGGVIAALADTAAAIAVYTVIPSGVEIATVELKINYLSPLPGGKIKAVGTVLRAGRNFVIGECEVIDAKGDLAAKALLTFGAIAGTSLERPPERPKG